MQYRTTDYAAHTFDTFYFEKNLQGDIIAVYNADGEKIGSYTYDAWGNMTVTTTSGNTMVENGIVRTLNPFRYRGYYYDTETGLYYLQSRYYNPEWGRFLNADNMAVLSASPNHLTDKNLYAYCDNNPIIRKDGDGQFWHIIAGAVVGAAVSSVVNTISNAIEGKPLTEGLGVAIISGFASGALASSTAGLGTIVAGNAVLSMAENAYEQIEENAGFGNFNVGDMLFDGAVGAISGFLGSPGKGTKQLMTLGVQTVKRPFKTLSQRGIKAALLETKKAFVYYGKSAVKFYSNLIDEIPGDLVSSAITSLITSDSMKEQYQLAYEYICELVVDE